MLVWILNLWIICCEKYCLNRYLNSAFIYCPSYHRNDRNPFWNATPLCEQSVRFHFTFTIQRSHQNDCPVSTEAPVSCDSLVHSFEHEIDTMEHCRFLAMFNGVGNRSLNEIQCVILYICVAICVSHSDITDWM